MELKNFFAQDDQGNITPGATCYLYEVGTENLVQQMYRANGTALTNPFKAANDGLVQLAAANGRYDLRVDTGARSYRIHLQFNDVSEDLAAAKSSADRAELARDAAQLSAGLKSTVEKGLSETDSGEYFSVPGSDSKNYLVLYQNQDNKAVEISRYPNAEAISSMEQLIRPLAAANAADDHALTFEDANGFILGLITAARRLIMRGGLDIGTGSLESSANDFEFTDPNGFQVAKLGLQESNISGMNVKRSTGGDIEFGDYNGFVHARIGAEQSVVNGLALQSRMTEGVEITDENGFLLARFDNRAPALATANSQPLLNLRAQVRTAIMQIIEYGQSLGRGINSTPAISTIQPYKNIMLASGVKVRASEPGYNPTSFVPLVEATVSIEGETPVSGLCNGVVRRAVADGELAANWVLAATAVGRSGRAIEQLMPGDNSSDFAKLVQTIRDTKALADALGKSYSVWAYSWNQGESNYVGSYTRSAYLYMQYMLGLFDTLTAEIVAITGQQFRPYAFIYQVGAHRKYNVDKMDIALSQWRASREREDIVLAAPVYMFATGDDSLHLTNESSWLIGEYKSRAMYQTMIRRTGKWRPLEPVSVNWQASYIDIKFHVPSGPLVLDTALCTAEINHGFDIREDDIIADIITSVTVTGPDTVRLQLSRAASAGAVVSYARGRNTSFAGSGPTQGARGNLRDSNGDFDKAVSPLNNTFALHNACVMFQYDRRTGF